MPVLQIKNLLKTFPFPGQNVQRRIILELNHWSVERAEQVAIAGPSGMGKTTFLNLIAGILKPDRGQILVADQDMVALGESQRDRLRARHIGYVFQTFNLLQGYSALENVELAMMFGRGLDKARALNLLKQVGLEHRLHDRPRELSVGQQQRVAVARALANQPELVLADEPTGNLDEQNAQQVITLLREVCAEQGAALLLVTHDPAILPQFQRVESWTDLNKAFLPEASQITENHA